ncbi:MAG TPA: MFS transporter, partial [Jatrophihabitans sp.]|nr:MFS transporter [Jatrophihabitans sp.]
MTATLISSSGTGPRVVAPVTASLTSRTHGKDRRQLGLLMLAASEFMVVLDASIVNIALPKIGSALHMSGGALAWIITAYVVAFGALLPFGGRIADLLGRR